MSLFTGSSVYSSSTDGLLGHDTTPISLAPMDLTNQPVFWVLVATQATVGTYLLVAMIFSEWKHREPPTTTSQMHAKRLRQVCLFATSVGTTHLIVNVIALLTPASQKSCTLRLAIQKVTYCFGMFAVYAFLWLRQKLFYSNPSLRYLYNRTLRLCSWNVFAIIVICAVCQCTMTILGVMYLEDGEMLSKASLCINPQNRLWTVQITLAAVTSSLVHVSLMGLFIYPLWKHKLQTSSVFVRGHNGSFKSRSSINNTTQIAEENTLTKKNSLLRDSLRKKFSPANGIVVRSPSQNGNTPTTPMGGRKIARSDSQVKKGAKYVNDKLRTLIRRCLLLTITCVLTGISVTIITAIFYRGGLLATFLYGSNMLINMICCAGCFHNWRNTIFPFCKNAKKRKSSSTIVTSNRQDHTSHRLSRQFDSIV